MVSGVVEEQSPKGRGPLIRLRSILFGSVAVGAALWTWPRAMAAIELHSTGTLFADYALCMVGPTGPALLRDNPPEFLRLVHRRVVAAQPEDRPFAACAGAARTLTEVDRIATAHMGTADSFVEYGESAAEAAAAGRSATRVEQLRVTTRRLAELSAAAWPFAREGYTKLVRSSLGAREAAHPVGTPAPVLGRGLPAGHERYRPVYRTSEGWVVAWGTGANLQVFESRDGGVTFSPVSTRKIPQGRLAERCSSGEVAFTFGVSEDSRLLEISSQGPREAPRRAALGSADQSVFTASCDSRAAAVGLENETGKLTFRLCHRGGGCEPLHLPRLGRQDIDHRYSIDLARVEGATLLAVARHGVVRVTSSRDDGRSWTPYTVAYDRGSSTALRDLPVPTRLLPMGARTVLYAGAKDPWRNYPVLVSDDLGATWRTPMLTARVAEASRPR